jgi:hypothetical protein
MIARGPVRQKGEAGAFLSVTQWRIHPFFREISTHDGLHSAIAVMLVQLALD